MVVSKAAIRINDTFEVYSYVSILFTRCIPLSDPLGMRLHLQDETMLLTLACKVMGNGSTCGRSNQGKKRLEDDTLWYPNGNSN